MADLSDKLEIIDAMYKKAKTENYDIICGSRYMKGGKQIGGPKFKGFLSKMAGKSLHFLTTCILIPYNNKIPFLKK